MHLSIQKLAVEPERLKTLSCVYLGGGSGAWECHKQVTALPQGHRPSAQISLALVLGEWMNEQGNE